MLTVGVDLGGANIQTLVLEGDETLGSARMKTPTQGDRTLVLDVVAAALHAALGEADHELDEVAAVGIGTPGVVIDGTVGGASNIPDWYDRFGLADLARDKLGVPVRLANDGTAAAVGEHHSGAGRGTDHLLAITVGTGVGAGLILNGQPYEGGVGGAGEFGHTVVVQDGAVCPCGRRGCVEAYAGRRAMAFAAERAVAAGRSTVLFDIQEELGQQRPTSAVFKAALDRGDELAADLIDVAISALGVGIASAVNLLDVDAVVVGGGLSDRMGDAFFIRLEAAIRPNLFLQPPRVRLERAQLGDYAGALGAALLARDAAPR
ncbi:MAG: ROK family protein [Actinobacteria bacterium]|nr:ROK family protein [Actinomycetota bacterium]